MFKDKVKGWSAHCVPHPCKINLAWIQQHLARIIIVAPMSLLVVYLLIFSQPRYMSESTVAVKRPSDIEGSSLNVGLLLGASNPSSAEDSLYLKEYINSADMLRVLNKMLNFHTMRGAKAGWILSTIWRKTRRPNNSLTTIVTVSLSPTTIRQGYWLFRLRDSPQSSPSVSTRRC